MEAMGNRAVSWILQRKEIIGLVALLLCLWHLHSKHIPFLLMREQEKARQEADRFQQVLKSLEDRHQSNHAAIERLLEKLNDTLAEGLQHLKDVLVEHYRSTDGRNLPATVEKAQNAMMKR